jgi:hypothetical protein
MRLVPIVRVCSAQLSHLQALSGLIGFPVSASVLRLSGGYICPRKLCCSIRKYTLKVCGFAVTRFSLEQERQIVLATNGIFLELQVKLSELLRFLLRDD